jgi:hypothetical protein
VEITDEENGIVEFTFDSPQAPGNVLSTTFELIARDGTVYTSTAATTSPDSDEPSTVLEVDFNIDLSDSAPTAAADTIRRAGTTGTVGTRIQQVDVGSGATDGPDLASVETQADDEDLDADEARFIFDETIDTAGHTPGAFSLVYATGCGILTSTNLNAFANPDQDGEGWDDTVDISDSCLISGDDIISDPDDDRAVIVTFNGATVDNDLLVAAQVQDDAGVLADDDTSDANQDDELQLGDAADLFDDGQVLGPQLIGADLITDTNVFGDFTSYVLTLTFDKDLDDAAVGGDIKFWFQSGDDVESEILTGCEVDDDTTIVCEIEDEDSDIADATVISLDAGVVNSADTVSVDDTADLDVAFPSPEASAPVSLDEA